MNLLLLNHNLREHGTYFRAFHFGRELVRMGHRVTLLTASPDHWYRPTHHQAEGVEIIETPSWNPFVNRDDGFGPLDAAYRSLLMVRRRWDACYAFAHPPNVLLPHWLFRLIRRGPVAVDWCDLYGGNDGIAARRRQLWNDLPHLRPRSPLKRAVQSLAWSIERRAESHIVRHAPRLTVISSFLKHRALAMGVQPDRLLQLPSGAPTDLIHPLDKAAARNRIGLEPTAQPLLVYVANYHPDEDFLLDALQATPPHRQDDSPAFRVAVVGPPFSPGKLRERSLDSIVHEAGRRPFAEIPDWLAAADLLLLPYPDTVFNRSRWPNKIGDYLAAGRPTITNPTGDFAPLFKNNDIGIAAPGDPDAFGRAIADALAAQPRWDAWGASARRLAETELAWNRLAEQLARFWLG